MVRFIITTIIMGVFRYFRNALGFSQSESDEETAEGVDARVTPLRDRQETVAMQNVEPNSIQRPDVMSDKPAVMQENREIDTRKQMQLEIFDSVLTVFNESLPEFLQKTVDEKSQKEYLYERLDASAKEYLERIENEAVKQCNNRWEQERRRLLAEIDSLKSMASKEVEDSSEAKKQQLSAERQKRALTEKVRELEKQLADISAENEQYILENKSLVNKLRVTQVLGNEQTETDRGAAAKIAELAAGLENAQKELADRKEAAENEVENLKNEISSLKDALEQSKMKDDLGDAMLSDLNKRTAEAVEKAREQTSRAVMLSEENAGLRQKLDDAQKALVEETGKMNEMRSELESAKIRVEELSAEYLSLKVEHQTTAERLGESLENLKVVEEMNRQLDALEKARQNNEAFLHKQKDEILQKSERLRQLELENKEYADAIRQKDDAIRRLEDVTDSLRKTIENNIYEHSQSESALRSEIDRLKIQRSHVNEPQPLYQHDDSSVDITGEIETGGTSFEISVAEEHKPAAKKDSGKKRKNTQKKFKISAIDDTLEDTDWLISIPPAGKADSKTDASVQEFGYKEPPRKQTPENPAQMSLW